MDRAHFFDDKFRMELVRAIFVKAFVTKNETRHISFTELENYNLEEMLKVGCVRVGLMFRVFRLGEGSGFGRIDRREHGLRAQNSSLTCTLRICVYNHQNKLTHKFSSRTELWARRLL